MAGPSKLAARSMGEVVTRNQQDNDVRPNTTWPGKALTLSTRDLSAKAGRLTWSF